MSRHATVKASVLALFVAALVPAAAQASHYDLSSIDVVEEAHAKKLAELKIFTTKDLLEATAKGKPAKALAKKLKVGAPVVAKWHAFCGLLAIDGVGPKVVRVLIESGIADLDALAVQDPVALAQLVAATNARVQILGKLPEVDTVRTWIEQAKKLATPAKPGKGAAKKPAPAKKAGEGR
jgi:predicted flap endonuclease-1-like 5' DNA nuclease